MAKNSWNDYSATAASNTDVGGIDCDEGMAPGNVNNAMRELMSHTADVVAGTVALSSINIDGGSITGITDLAVADGGTGASTASAALSNLGGIGPASTDTLTNKTFDANATGNALSNVDVADLAAGTDGELITWDTSGNPATVAVGSASQVLTSNGAGAAPTFQDAAGGGRTISMNQKALGDFSSTTINGDVLPTGWSITHTLASAGNALLFQGYARGYNPNCAGNVYTMIKLFQDGSQLSESSAPDSGSIDYVTESYFSSQNFMNPMYIETLIKPGDTSSHTYQLYVYGNAGAQGGPATSWSNAFMRITEIDGTICTVA